MSYFMPEPKIILNNSDDLLNALNNSEWSKDHDFKWNIKSIFIIECIQEIIDSGKFAYNSDVNRLVCEKLGLSTADCDLSGTPLSLLVYNAQNYRHSDILKSNGFSPLTQELVEKAYAQKRKIELQNMVVYNVRKIGDNIYVMKPRARNYAVSIQGQPARMV